jgi:hypothetical protein
VNSGYEKKRAIGRTIDSKGKDAARE